MVNGLDDKSSNGLLASGAQRGSKTLDNGLRVLRTIAAHADGVSVTRLAGETTLHRTVLYRLLLTLTAHDMVVQAPDGKYHVGLGATELAAKVRRDLRSMAEEPLRRLAEVTHATAHLTVADGDDGVSLAVVEPANVVAHVAYREGSRHPLDKGAAGLAILLGRGPRKRERMVIKQGRKVGFIVSRGELETGAWGLAAPVRTPGKEVSCAVGIVALSALDVRAVAPHVLSAAADLARRMPQ